MTFRMIGLMLLSAMVFTACKKSNKQGRYIPENASMVVHINGATISEKLPWDEVKKGPAVQKILNDSSVDAFVRSIFNNPDESGLQTKGDILFFIQSDSLGGYGVMQASVLDGAKVAAIAKKIEGAKTTEANGITTVVADKAVMQWDKEKCMVAYDIPEMNNSNAYSFDVDEEENQVVKPGRNMAITVQNLFNLKEDASLAGHDKFTTLMNEKGDVHFWLNNEALMGNNPELSQIGGIVKFDKFYKESYQTATIRFENGKIEADLMGYMSKEMNDLMKKYEGKNISRSMAERMPAENIAVYMGMNFKPELIREFIKLAGIEGFVNMGLGMSGISMDDLMGFSTGEFALGVFDIPAPDTSNIFSSQEPTILFAAEIKDKDATNRMLNAMKKMMGSDESLTMSTKDNMLAMSNKKSGADAFLKGSGGKATYFDQIANSTFGMYIDLKYILRSIPVSKSDSLDMAIQQYNVAMWDKVIVNDVKHKKGGLHQHAEVRMQDTQVNSLKQLNALLNQIVLWEEARKARYASMDEWDFSDDVAVEVAP
ncbi:MAG: DUF4836 family protein [Ferruginibacter sp.]|nr:DUF4836 family protein [Ferruginibacter sp.]